MGRADPAEEGNKIGPLQRIVGTGADTGRASELIRAQIAFGGL